MKLYVTYGTVDYLQKLLTAHRDKNLRLMANENTGVLFHETDGTSIFNVPKRYEIVDSTGELANGIYAVAINVPVSYEGRPLYEKRFSDQADQIQKAAGISAIRVLRPVKGDTYIILTLWENEQYYKTWQDSNVGIEQQSTFPRPSYVAKYVTVEVDD